ncbi:unnamed protein product [Arabidopsis halleri]
MFPPISRSNSGYLILITFYGFPEKNSAEFNRKLSPCRAVSPQILTLPSSGSSLGSNSIFTDEMHHRYHRAGRLASKLSLSLSLSPYEIHSSKKFRLWKLQFPDQLSPIVRAFCSDC